jgi:hypothetical protein
VSVVMEESAVDLRERCAAQIADLHRVIEDWPTGRSGRCSTVVLVRDAAAPHGLRSRHLHETWISHGQ